jgi:hypothetical protein
MRACGPSLCLPIRAGRQAVRKGESYETTLRHRCCRVRPGATIAAARTTRPIETGGGSRRPPSGRKRGGVEAGGPGGAPGNRPYYRPNANVTRGQLAKIVSNTAAFTETPTAQTFEDVPPGSTFYLWVERVAGRGIINGYPCGAVGEPCVAPANPPYYRPASDVTRGQTSKIVANTFYPGCQTPARR